MPKHRGPRLISTEPPRPGSHLPRPTSRDGRPDHRLLFEIAADHGGYFTADQARTAGFSSNLIRYHVRRGKFRNLQRRTGVYRLRDFPSGPHEDLWAALAAAGSDSVLSHETALALHRLSDVVPRGISLWIPYKKRWLKPKSVARGARLHVARHPLQPDEVTQVDGLPVTSPLRTLIDVARAGTNPRQVVLAIKHAVERHWATPDSILQAVRVRGDGRALTRVTHFIQEASE